MKDICTCDDDHYQFPTINVMIRMQITKQKVSGGFDMLSLAMPFVTPYSTIPKIFEKKVT